MAKKIEHIVGLHNLFPTAIERIDGVDERYYDLSINLDYNQSVSKNTILFVDADYEDVNKYIHINSTFKRIRPGDNYIISDGKVYSNNFSIEGQYIPSYVKGPKGEPGKDGIDGKDGLDGAQGPTGAQGIQGPTGPTGPVGPTGSRGAQGIKGPTGPTGVSGKSIVFYNGDISMKSIAFGSGHDQYDWFGGEKIGDIVIDKNFDIYICDEKSNPIAPH